MRVGRRHTCDHARLAGGVPGRHPAEQEPPRPATSTGRDPGGLAMTFREAQRAAWRGGHRLVNAGRTPNGLFCMLVCALRWQDPGPHA
jgi:hypothetical protein